MTPSQAPGLNSLSDAGGVATVVTGRSVNDDGPEKINVHEMPSGDSAADEKTTQKSTVQEDIIQINGDEESIPIGKGMTASQKVQNMEEIALYALHVEDDPTLNPWTFRTWFLGKNELYDDIEVDC
jgi:hypothetical protein